MAGGRFNRAGDVAVNGIATWNGIAWEAMPPGPLAEDRVSGAWTVHALTTWNGRLVVSGELKSAADATLNGLGVWDGARWDPLVAGHGVTGNPQLRVIAGETYLDSRGGIAGPRNVRGTARWEHDHWQALTMATDDGRSFATTPATMAEHDGRVIALGRLRAGPPPPGCAPDRSPWHLAELRDRWHVISPALPGAKSTCTGLLDLGAEVLALGAFGDQEKPNEGAMVWDGAVWRPGGLELAGGDIGAAVVAREHAFVVLRHDSFDAKRAARCAILEGDGRAWRSIRETKRAAIPALVNWGGRLVAGFDLGDLAASESHHVEAWDGRRWTSLPGSFSYHFEGDGRLAALAVHEGHLIAAGTFRGVDGCAAANIAFLADDAWRPLGDGLDQWVGQVGSAGDGLWVGGSFTRAGGEPSVSVARWEGPLPVATPLASLPPFMPQARPTAAPKPAFAAADTATALVTNGRFEVLGRDRVPRGWNWRTWCPDSAAIAATPAPLDDGDGGIRLEAGREPNCLTTLTQSFAVGPGRCYRLRARCDARDEPTTGDTGGWRLGFGDYGRTATGGACGPLHTGMEVALPAAGGWAEVTLRADSTATDGTVTITARGPSAPLVLREIVCDTVTATDAEVLHQVCDALRPLLVRQRDGEIAWDSLEAAAATRLQPGGSLISAVIADLLTALDEPRVTLQSGHSDTRMIGILSEGEPLPESDGLSSERAAWIRSQLSDWQPYAVPTGWLRGDIAYVGLVSVPTGGDWRTDLAGAAGLLLDLRGCPHRSGRQAESLRTLAALCVPAPRIWGYARPPAGTADAAEDTLRLQPATGARLDVPVVCLIDAATREATTEFALMLRGLPGVTLVGRPTRGGTGGPRKLPIPTGHQIDFPGRELHDAAGRLVNDDHGVEPDVRVAPDRTPDAVFTEGLRILRERLKSTRR